MNMDESRLVVTELFNDGLYNLRLKEDIYPDYTLKRYNSELLAKRDDEGYRGQIARYLPTIYIDGDDFGQSKEYKVRAQTTSFGSLASEDYDNYTKANMVGYQTIKMFEDIIKRYEAGEEIKSEIIFDSDNLKDGE